MKVTPLKVRGAKSNPPTHEEIECASGTKIIRFDNLTDLFYYDVPDNNPNSLYVHRYIGERTCGDYERLSNDPNYISGYLKTRSIFTSQKKDIYKKAMEQVSKDGDLQKLLHVTKSDKRTRVLNKFGGNFQPVEFAVGQDKVFSRLLPGKKHPTINMAFQVGTFSGGDYTGSFIKILTAILTAQAMGVRLNIDMFDSDTSAVWSAKKRGRGYIICNVARSSKKLDFNRILITSNSNFFNYSLFNGYSAQGLHQPSSIASFLSESSIIKDLSPYYDVIGGNSYSIEKSEENLEEPGSMKNIATNKLIKILRR